MERVITRVSKESRSDFLTFPNIRTSLSFSFFTGRADLFRAKTRRWSVIDRYRAHVEILVRSLGLDQEGEGDGKLSKCASWNVWRASERTVLHAKRALA